MSNTSTAQVHQELKCCHMRCRGRLIENFRSDTFGKIEGDQTPLHYAARAGSAICCKVLILGYVTRSEGCRFVQLSLTEYVYS